MPKSDSTSKSRKGSTPQRDQLAPYRQRAKLYLDLYFRESTPEFIQDLISSWMTALANETGVDYASSRAVADVFLPLALQQADRANIDTEDPAGFICSNTFQECITVNTTRDTGEPSAREVLKSELERDAAALARLLTSPHLPTSTKVFIGEAYQDFAGQYGEAPEVVKVQWPLAVLASMEGGD